METLQREKKKGGRRCFWIPVVALLVLAALVAAAVCRELRREEELVPEKNTVVVNDGVNLVEITPHAGLPVNERRAEDFSSSGDMVLYSGPARQGIDVSEFQGEIDWSQVADSGIEFAFLRLGYRGATQGLLYEDERFRDNLSGAVAAGLDVGVYFFSQALDEEEAAEEADFVLAALDGAALALPVMFDWEPSEQEGSRTAGREAEVIGPCAAAFCRQIAWAGYEAGVYFNRQQGYYRYDLSALGDYTFWVSDPNAYPDFYYDFHIWQYSFTGTVPGIGPPVDRNLIFD